MSRHRKIMWDPCLMLSITVYYHFSSTASGGWLVTLKLGSVLPTVSLPLAEIELPGNTKGGSITVLLTSYLTGL
jgi:hypothetical protein